MAALRSGTTRRQRQAVTVTSSITPGGRKKKRRLGKEGKEEVEVIDLCDSSSGSDSSGEEDERVGKGKVVVVENGKREEEDKGEGEEDFVEVEEKDIGYRAFFDFESDNSMGNQTVKSFLRDCWKQPKILCHKKFQELRGFMEVAMGIKFTLPEDAPFKMDHEDDTFCVDKGDKWLEELKARLKSPQPSEEDDDSSSDEDDDPPPYYWAVITPLQRKSDLGLVVWKWTPQPMTLILLDIYLTFCREKYVPPKPPPPPPPKRKVGRKKKKRKSPVWMAKKEEIVPPPEQVVPPEEEEENGVDDYIKEFVGIFRISRNMDVEDRLKGDIEARARRSLENKEEPKHSRELSLLLRRNPLMTTPVTTLSSRKPPRYSPLVNGSRQRQESDNSSSTSSSSVTSSSSSSTSNGSTVAFPIPKGPPRKPAYQRRKVTPSTTPATKPPATKLAAVVTNGLIKMNATVKNGTIKRSSRSSTSSSSSSSSPSGGGGVKKPSKKIRCDVCQPSIQFGEWRTLQRHLELVHSSRKRDLVSCDDCGSRVKKEGMDFHKRFCRKAIILGGITSNARGSIPSNT